MAKPIILVWSSGSGLSPKARRSYPYARCWRLWFCHSDRLLCEVSDPKTEPWFQLSSLTLGLFLSVVMGVPSLSLCSRLNDIQPWCSLLPGCWCAVWYIWEPALILWWRNSVGWEHIKTLIWAPVPLPPAHWVWLVETMRHRRYEQTSTHG